MICENNKKKLAIARDLNCRVIVFVIVDWRGGSFYESAHASEIRFVSFEGLFKTESGRAQGYNISGLAGPNRRMT